MALESSLRRGRPMEALEGWFRWARAHPPTPTGAAGEGPTARLRRLVAASAISHYNDLTTVAAAMAALDVCSLPTWPLRVDVAALRRIAVHRASQVTPVKLRLGTCHAVNAHAAGCPKTISM